MGLAGTSGPECYYSVNRASRVSLVAFWKTLLRVDPRTQAYVLYKEADGRQVGSVVVCLGVT